MDKNNEVSQISNRNIYCSRSNPAVAFNMQDAHYHNHYEIYYLLSGKRKYFIENRIFNVKKGDIILIPKGVLHKTSVSESSKYRRLLISFNDNMIYPEFKNEINECFAKHYYGISPPLSSNLEVILLKIEREFKDSDKFSEQIIKGLLFELFVFLARHYDKCLSEGDNEKSDAVVQKAADFISKNFDNEITLKDAAKHCLISAEHLSRKFKKDTGFHFSEYLTLVRIMQAEKLLVSSDNSMTEIASQCGFNDSNYFSSVFKKVKGISPSKYRKTIQS